MNDASRRNPNSWFVGAIIGVSLFVGCYFGQTLVWAVIHDSVPLASRVSFAARWQGFADVFGTVCAVCMAAAAFGFVGLAKDAPAVTRRVGVVLLLCGLLAAGVATAVVIVGAANPAVRPGAAPAGDVAPLFIGVVVGVFAIVICVLGAATWGAGWVWSRWRVRRANRH